MNENEEDEVEWPAPAPEPETEPTEPWARPDAPDQGDTEPDK